MAAIYYQASHEQFKPSELLKYVKQAEEAGFNGVNSSDHFHPWSERQGQSGFSFAWLGAAMQSCSLPFSMVCAPGQRYHPAIVAQAIATLAELFPGRLSVALGSGEALNERITGEIWPDKTIRNQRLQECYDVISKLLKGEEVSHRGLVTVAGAKLYSLPEKLPTLKGAAVSLQTAAWMGGWAPGLLTVAKPMAEMRKLVEGFRNNGGSGKPMAVKIQLAYASSIEEARQGAYDQWRTNIFHESVLGELNTVAQFDALAKMVSPKDLDDSVNISTDLNSYVKLINEYAELGFDEIILHQVTRDQELFIKHFGESVIPALKCTGIKTSSP